MLVRIESGDCPKYLTRGKVYEVVDTLCYNFFTVFDDLGVLRFLSRTECYHLNGGSWEVVDV